MKNKIIVATLILVACTSVFIALPTPASALEISSVAVSVTAPVVGQTSKIDTVSSDPTQYVGDGGYWVKCNTMNNCSESTLMLASDTFVAGQRYQVTLHVKATAGNIFRTSTDPRVTVNGLSAGIKGFYSENHGITLYQQFIAPYTFTLTPSSNFTFPAKTAGYSTPDGYEFTVKNTTNGSGITIYTDITGDGASAFNIKTALPGSPVAEINLGTNGSVKFTITPKTGLSPGTYNAKITVVGNIMVSMTLSFNISFTVNPASTPPPTPATVYSITVQDNANGIAWADKTSAVVGTNITLFTNAKPGYVFKKWDVISGGVNIIGDEFTMPSNDVTVKALFEKTGDAQQDTEDSTTNGDSTEVEDELDGDGEANGDEMSDGADRASGFNWLWVLFGLLVVIAAGGGIWFFIIRKHDETQDKKAGNQTDNDETNNSKEKK